MPTELSPERYEFDWEIVGLIDEYGSERAALRATYAALRSMRAGAEHPEPVGSSLSGAAELSEPCRSMAGRL